MSEADKSAWCREHSVYPAGAGQLARQLHHGAGRPRGHAGRAGVKPSYSRHRVSDDNAYAESLFRTAMFILHRRPQGWSIGATTILTRGVQAQQRNPAGWSGKTRDWSPIGVVTLNPERDAVIKLATMAQHTQQKAAWLGGGRSSGHFEPGQASSVIICTSRAPDATVPILGYAGVDCRSPILTAC